MSFDVNGQLIPPEAAPPTRKLWADMLGLGEFFRVISDPSLMTRAQTMMSAVIEHAAAMKRIEEKLDRILEERNGMRRDGPAAISSAIGADGTGRRTAAGGVANDGDRHASQHGDSASQGD